MSMEHTASNGMVDTLKSMPKTVRLPEVVVTGIVTGIKLFDENLSPADRILLDQAVNNTKGLGDFETVQNYFDTASDEDRKALEVEVGNFKYCIDEVAKKAALKSIVTNISKM